MQIEYFIFTVCSYPQRQNVHLEDMIINFANEQCDYGPPSLLMNVLQLHLSVILPCYLLY